MTEEVSEEVQQQLAQLQMLERNMQSFGMQRQMMQAQLVEVESALDEIKNTDRAFKIVGNIMVATKKPELEKELKEKQKVLKKRVDTFESQEKKMKEQLDSLQQELLKAIK